MRTSAAYYGALKDGGDAAESALKRREATVRDSGGGTDSAARSLVATRLRHCAGMSKAAAVELLRSPWTAVALSVVAGVLGWQRVPEAEAARTTAACAAILVAVALLKASEMFTPPPAASTPPPAPSCPNPPEPDPDCWRHPSAGPLPASTFVRYFDAAAALLAMASCVFFARVLYLNDIDDFAASVGGQRGGGQVDYAAEGSCQLWLTGGPWPPAEVVDAFLFFHFITCFLVMLAYRDFYLCCLLSPLVEICECSFQHVLPNFKECVWDSWGLDVLTFNAFGIWLGYRVLRYFEIPQYDLFGLQPSGARHASPTVRGACCAGVLVLHSCCMSTHFFLKHVVAIKETSPWFTLVSVIPLQLGRSGTESMVRRYYLGETQLPAVPKSVVLLLVNLGLQILTLLIVVPPESTFRVPAKSDLPDNSLVGLHEGDRESLLHALFFGAPWYTFVIWWPAVVWSICLAAKHVVHPYVVMVGFTLLCGFFTTIRYSPVL